LCTIFFSHCTATPEIYTLSLHDALPISGPIRGRISDGFSANFRHLLLPFRAVLNLKRVFVWQFWVFQKSTAIARSWWDEEASVRDRKSTRLNSSHLVISYAVFCLKKKI